MGVYQEMFYDRMTSLRKSKVPSANSHTMFLDNRHIGDPHLEQDPHLFLVTLAHNPSRSWSGPSGSWLHAALH